MHVTVALPKVRKFTSDTISAWIWERGGDTHAVLHFMCIAGVVFTGN